MKRYDLGWSEGDPFDGDRSYPAIVEERNGDYVRWPEVEQLTTERDALRARVAELTNTLIRVEAAFDTIGTGVGPRDNESRLLRLGVAAEQVARNVKALDARLAALEATPVVPEGFHVVRTRDAWDWERSGSIPLQLPAALYRALAWAIEHDQRPPHAEDELTP